MHLDNWNNLIQAIGGIIGLVIAIFGVATYFMDKRIETRNRTIEKVGELLEEYHEKYRDLDINDHFMEHVRFLSQIEQFCIAVDSKVYSKKTLNKFGSKFLCSIYKKYEDNVIATRKKNLGEDKYQYLEKLVKSFTKEKQSQ